jgi:protein-S-isoprenylcysteine O-methyltransferase Ste14
LRPLLSLIAFAVLVLAGFGSVEYWDDWPRILFFISGLIGTFWISLGKSGMKPTKERGESNLWFVLLIFMTFATAFFIPFFAGRKITLLGIPVFFRFVGIPLFISGLVIRSIAIRTLKRQFSIYVGIQENHQLITTGIYSRIRHPIYLGAILSLTGFALVFPTLLGFLFVIIYSMLLGHRMTQEEKLMWKHFGSVYEEYVSKSYRLIPHIY